MKVLNVVAISHEDAGDASGVSAMTEHNIPAPHYTLIETSRGNDPAIVVINSALRRFGEYGYAWADRER